MNTPRYETPLSPDSVRFFTEPHYDIPAIIREMRRIQQRLAVVEDELRILKIHELVKEQQAEHDRAVTPAMGYGEIDE